VQIVGPRSVEILIDDEITITHNEQAVDCRELVFSDSLYEFLEDFSVESLFLGRRCSPLTRGVIITAILRSGLCAPTSEQEPEDRHESRR
jgi:hypothetical protein